MDTILTSIKDLIKYYILQNVSVGDRALDTAIHAVILTTVSYLFTTSFNFNQLWFWYYKNQYIKIDHANIHLFEKYYDIHRKYMKTVLVNNLYHAEQILNYTSEFHSMIFELDNNLQLKKYIANTSDKVIPVYWNRGFIGIRKLNTLEVIYDKESVYQEFINLAIKLESETYKKDSPKTVKIIDKDQKSIIYPDRNLNMFISKHKPRILNLLRNFVKSNQQGADFNGYGTYNLGIIVYGKPGTGKTMLIKSICNYLQRSAYIIDMRHFKTRDKFNCLFATDYQKYIYVLDEFDCVQDVIKKRHSQSDTNIQTHQQKIQRLNDRLLELYKVPSQDQTKEEIKKISNQIVDLENVLTLDTVLQVLDGINEHRGRVIIATTNHIEDIDPALLREGRFDAKICLDAFDHIEAKELLQKMFAGKSTTEELENLNNCYIPDGIYTPTTLINLAVSLGSLNQVLEHIKKN